MIELRWLCATEDDPAPVLQWRWVQDPMEIGRAKWSKWQTVPRVVREGEDRQKSPAPPPPPPPRLIKEDVPLFPMREGEGTK